jgi:two-component system, NtrC family, sensor histidine kinase PilS
MASQRPGRTDHNTTSVIPHLRDEQGAPSPGDSLIGAKVVAKSDVRARVVRQLLLRTLIVTVVLGLSLWLLTTGDSPAEAAVWLQSSIIVVTYLSSIVFGVLLRRGAAPTQVARMMQASDLAVTSLLIYVTGGAQSPYTFLYALSIVGAGAVAYRRGAIVVTLASLGSLALVSLLAWTHTIDLPVSAQVHPWEQAGGELVRSLGINIAALIGVGGLALTFGDQLQRGAETLASTRMAAAELLTLHQDIVRSLSSGLITTAPDGVILTANEIADDILRAKIALVGQPIDAVMPGLAAQLAAGHGELRRADVELPSGGKTLGVTVSPLRDVHDHVIGSVVNFQDLTELRRLELHMRRAERLATVGQLAAGVAHEIRNPLASISGSIELLRQAPQASDDDRTLMTIIHREIQRLNELIGDLLDYANPKPKQPVDFDLGVLVTETLQVAQADPAFGSVELSSQVAMPLPVHADPAKLRQVLWNLLRNAADAARSGGQHVRVEALADPDDLTSLTITVADDGPGIARGDLLRLFDPFFTTKQRGTGLGLATCHSIIAEHDGRIDVDTELGKGTRMIVRLPR